jgi:flagellar biosynthesis/type III secretory pathway protein FliH
MTPKTMAELLDREPQEPARSGAEPADLGSAADPDVRATFEALAADPGVREALEKLRDEGWDSGFSDGWKTGFSRGYAERIKDIRKAMRE